MLPQRMNITKIYAENYRTKTYVLDASWKGYPGQFAMVWLPRFDEKPFSLVHTDPVTLMVTNVGPFSNLVHQLREGDPLWLRGALGQGFRVPATEKRLALIGGGYGVAPLFWLAQTQTATAESIDVIIGARKAEDILYVERFRRLAAMGSSKGKITIHIATEDGSAGTQGMVTAILKPLVEQGQVDGIYGCGPHGMLAALQQLGKTYRLPTQLSWEAYMRCGIGICGACEHEGTVLCMDGPVLAK